MQWIRSKFCNITRRQIAFLAIGAALLFVFFLPSFVHAGMSITNILQMILGNLIQWLMNIISQIMLWAMNGVVAVAMYNDYAHATAVSIGWILIRDITNMFLVALMLMMAFGTLLNRGDLLGDYKSLPKFVIIAIVINFSKMITLLIIDIGQVVMLSFVAAFQNSAGGNFLKAFGMTKWLQASTGGSAANYGTNLVLALLMALVLSAIVLVVMLVFLAYLIARIAMLWILLIFSPLAFALKLMPTRGQKFYGQWWEYLISTIIAGPLLAFFLWLTLITAGVSNGSLGTEVMADAAAVRAAQQGELAAGQNVGKQSGITILNEDTLTTFMISVIMLLLGLKITSEMGGVVGGAIAGKGLGAVKGGAKLLVKKGYQKTKEKAANTRIPFTGGQTYAGRAKAKKAIKEERLSSNQKYAELQSRKALGDTRGAAKLEASLVNDERENVKGLNQADKIQALNNAPEGSLEQQAIKLELASGGYYNDKLHEVDDAIGGNKEFGIKFKAEIKKSGGQVLDIKPGQTAAEVISEKFANGDKDIIKNLPSRVKLARSSSGEVKMADPHAMDVLEAIPPDQFAKYSASQKQSVNDSFMLAMKNNSDMANPDQVAQLAKLKAKFESLNGLAGATYDNAGGGGGVGDYRLVSARVTEKKNAKGDIVRKEQTVAEYADTASKLRARQGSSVAKQSSGLSAASLTEQRKVDGAIPAQDVAVSRGVASMSSSERSLFDASASVITSDADADIAAGNFADASTKMSTELTNIEDRFRGLDGTGHSTKATNKDGSTMTNEEAVGGSTLSAAIKSLKEAVDARAALPATATAAEEETAMKRIAALQKELKEVVFNAQRRQGAVSGASSRLGRKMRTGARKKLSVSAPAVKSAATRANSAATESDQAAAIRDYRAALAKAMDHLHGASKESKVPVARLGEVAQLKRDLAIMAGKLQANRVAGRDNAADLAELKRIKDEFDRLNDELG